MSNEDTLISQLIEETCNDESEKEQMNPIVNLRNYFEKRLNEVDFNSISDYLSQNYLGHVLLKFEQATGCYRLEMKEATLDFPSNWSVFSMIKDANLIYLDSNLDSDFLLDIFAEVTGGYHNIAFVKENNIIQLVFLPEASSRNHVDWFMNYFDKKSGRENIAA